MFLIGVSGADAVTQGDHKGYVARTQPNTKLQGSMYAKFVVSKKEWKRVAYLALQTPYARSFGDAFGAIVRAAGVTITTTSSTKTRNRPTAARSRASWPRIPT